MDGFAVRSEDLANAVPTAPVTLPVTGAVVAGASGVPALRRGRPFAWRPARRFPTVPTPWSGSRRLPNRATR